MVGRQGSRDIDHLARELAFALAFACMGMHCHHIDISDPGFNIRCMKSHQAPPRGKSIHSTVNLVYLRVIRMLKHILFFRQVFSSRIQCAKLLP